MQYVEAVMKGQSDKVCDFIADAILDEYLKRDPHARVSLEVIGSHGMMMIGGEVTSTADFDVAAIAKMAYREIGYQDDIEILVNIAEESVEALAIAKRGGASDSCLASGYATSATPQFLPKAFVIAQALVKRLDDLRAGDAEFSWLKPDGRVTVGVEGMIAKHIMISVAHDEGIEDSFLRTRLFERVIVPVIGSADGVQISINQGGHLTQAGFQAATGMTGKRISCDTYGGLLPWNGGSLSGKDPANIERLAAYFCRYVAKNLVARGVGRAVMVDAVYARGVDTPVSVRARTGEGKDIPKEQLAKFDFRPAAIMDRLGLRKPLYKATACYGHFGRDGFPWEKIEP